MFTFHFFLLSFLSFALPFFFGIVLWQTHSLRNLVEEYVLYFVLICKRNYVRFGVLFFRLLFSHPQFCAPFFFLFIGGRSAGSRPNAISLISSFMCATLFIISVRLSWDMNRFYTKHILCKLFFFSFVPFTALFSLNFYGKCKYLFVS